MWTWMRKMICPSNINTKEKAKKYFWGINFTLISVSTVAPKIHQWIPRKIHQKICSDKFPSDSCRSLLVMIGSELLRVNNSDLSCLLVWETKSPPSTLSFCASQPLTGKGLAESTGCFPRCIRDVDCRWAREADSHVCASSCHAIDRRLG